MRTAFTAPAQLNTAPVQLTKAPAVYIYYVIAVASRGSRVKAKKSGIEVMEMSLTVVTTEGDLLQTADRGHLKAHSIADEAEKRKGGALWS